jgi:hypothetical protein
MAKMRSPNYPSLILKDAITRVKKVYDLEHTHAAPREVVAKALGYNSLNGTSLSILGTLKVTADAVTALELDEGHPERIDALKRLAFHPTLFAELDERFPNELPSDVNLKHFLIQQKEFLPKAAEDVIRIYRENLELVRDRDEPDNGGDQEPKGENPPMQTQNQRIQMPPLGGATTIQPTKRAYEFSFPLSFQRDVTATITIHGDKLKKRDLEFLQTKVGDLLKGFEEEEPETEASTGTREDELTLDSES